MLKKMLFVLLGLLLTATVILLVIYFRETSGCILTASSEEGSGQLHIVDKKKLCNFINQMTKCDKGYYTVYDFMGTKAKKKVKTIEYVLSSKDQNAYLGKPDGGVIFGYSINIDINSSKAVIRLSLPQDTVAEKDNLFTGIFATTYNLLTGQPYSRNEILLQFKSLDDLGILYQAN